MGLMSAAFMTRLFAAAFYEAGFDRQFGRRQQQSLLGDLRGHAIDLEDDASRLDPRDPKLRRALAGAHAHFQRLLGDRNVWKHADPHPPGTLHVAGECAPRRLDLPCRDPVRLQRLEAELTERQVDRARRDALDAALVRLPEFRSHRLQHGGRLCSASLVHAASRRGRPTSASAIFLSWAMGSCSMISPLKIHTFTPQVPYVVNAVATP